MDISNDPDDEIAIDPLPVPGFPLPPFLPAITGRLRHELLANGTWRPTRWGWLLGVVAAVVLLGVLKLAGVIWTTRPPAWVPALGPGVTVTGPERVAPGQDSPGAALAGALAAVSSRDPATVCDYLYPVGPARQCVPSYSHASRDQLPWGVSFRIGYVAIDGTRALVGFTGKVCSPGDLPECVTNTSPAAIFSSGSTFTTLWTQATSLTPGDHVYSLQPCAEKGGKWYLGSGPPGDS
jgi:hypothetical protein